jgi:hypothetical protein
VGDKSAEGEARVEAEVVTDPRHRALLDIVKKIPSDFAPWGERSREEEEADYLSTPSSSRTASSQKSGVLKNWVGESGKTWPL